MLAIAILVANGALLFVILRFLLWLAFPSTKDGGEAAPGRTAVAATGAAAVAELGAAAASTGPVTPVAPDPPPVLGTRPRLAAAGSRQRAYPHRLLIGLPVILALFAGGVWLGSFVGGSDAAAAASTVTIKVKGKVVTVNHTAEIRVPGHKVTVKGRVVTVNATTLTLPPQTQTVTNVVRKTQVSVKRLPGKTTVFTTVVSIPTTVTETGTTTTVTETTTETVTSGSTATSATT
jgi:hypothetical protein